MKKLKAFLGYFLAALGVPLVLATFMGMQPFSELLVDITGVKISPWITGGEVERVVKHERYQTNIYQAVFDGLLWQRKEGFVQVVWTPSGNLPEEFSEEIDYDGDGQADFAVTLQPEARTVAWQALNPRAVAIEGPYQIGSGVGVRVTLQRTP